MNDGDDPARQAAERIARECLHIIRGCLREEEWCDAYEEFLRVALSVIRGDPS